LRTAITFDDLSSNYVSYSMLEQLLAFLHDVNIPGTLFVIPKNYDQNSEENYTRLLRKAKICGHEIALHGYSHTKNEFGYLIPIPLPGFERQKKLLRMGKEYLQKCLGESPLGFRAPSYRHSKTTLRALVSLDFKYDSSKTVFKPTHGMRFRFKTSLLPNLTKMGPLFEIPVTADYTYNLDATCFKQLLKLARDDFNWIRGLDGIFVVNNHINRSGTLGFKFLRTLIDESRDETDFVRLKDLIL